MIFMENSIRVNSNAANILLLQTMQFNSQDTKILKWNIK